MALQKDQSISGEPLPHRIIGCLPELKIQGLQQAGAFRDPGVSVEIDWTDSAARSGLLTIETGSAAWGLTFRCRESVAWEQPIVVGYVRCNYGSRAHWLCPRCVRRCNVLFERDGRFACRRCHALRYRSQRESKLKRALAQAMELNARLGRASQDLWEPITARPPGMRWNRFRSLSQRFLAQQGRAAVLLREFSAKMWERRERQFRRPVRSDVQ